MAFLVFFDFKSMCDSGSGAATGSPLEVKLTGHGRLQTDTSFTADPVSHSEQAGGVDERAGHVFIIRHVYVIPDAVVDAHLLLFCREEMKVHAHSYNSKTVNSF